MSRRYYAWVLLLPLVAAGDAAADRAMPLSYSRTEIVITRAAPPASDMLPWQDAATYVDPGAAFDTEIREGTTLYRQEGWFNLSAQKEDGAVMLLFSVPVVTPIIASSQYAPLDILMISKEGRIEQIMPSLLLSELEEEIYPPNPILAFLFLPGGACEQYSIRPGDYVNHPRFKKPPKILSVPPVSPKPPVQ